MPGRGRSRGPSWLEPLLPSTSQDEVIAIPYFVLRGLIAGDEFRGIQAGGHYRGSSGHWVTLGSAAGISWRKCPSSHDTDSRSRWLVGRPATTASRLIEQAICQKQKARTRRPALHRPGRKAWLDVSGIIVGRDPPQPQGRESSPSRLIGLCLLSRIQEPGGPPILVLAACQSRHGRSLRNSHRPSSFFVAIRAFAFCWRHPAITFLAGTSWWVGAAVRFEGNRPGAPSATQAFDLYSCRGRPCSAKSRRDLPEAVERSTPNLGGRVWSKINWSSLSSYHRVDSLVVKLGNEK